MGIGRLLPLLLFSTTLFADPDVALFKERCLKCHKKKGAETIRPVDKARKQWVRFFKRQKHRPPLALDASLQKRLLNFLKDHAADSDQPMVPGL